MPLDRCLAGLVGTVVAHLPGRVAGWRLKTGGAVLGRYSCGSPTIVWLEGQELANWYRLILLSEFLVHVLPPSKIRFVL